MIEHVTTTASQEATSKFWVRVFLAALVAVLATILSSASASAATQGVAETRVRVSAVVAEVPVGPPVRIDAGQRQGNDGLRVATVVATGVAANSAGDGISIYKASQPGLTPKHLAEGYAPEDFPGSAFFTRDKPVAEHWGQIYGEGLGLN